MTWERARRPEQKQERREAILGAAAALFDDEGFEGASLSTIGRGSGIFKANLYRYFESREAILLELMAEEQRGWERAVAADLAGLAGSGDAERVAALLARSLAIRPRLCGLMASLASMLGHNTGAKTVADFKRRFTTGMLELLPSLHAVLPDVPIHALQEFLLYTYMFATGAWPHANRSAPVGKILANAEFGHIRTDFESVLGDHALALLRGLAAKGGDPASSGGDRLKRAMV